MSIPEYIAETLKVDNDLIQKYGEKVALLTEVGEFYELFFTDERRGRDICVEAMQINLRLMTEHSSSTPIYTGGFPLTALKKFVKLLLQSSYIVVVYNQDTDPNNKKKKIRTFTAKYNSTTDMDDEFSSENQLIMCIHIEYEGNDIIDVNLCTIEAGTGISTLMIGDFRSYSEINKQISKLNPREVLIYTSDSVLEKAELNDLIHLEGRMIHFRINNMPAEFKKVSYQNSFLGTQFDCRMVVPIEYLNLNRYPGLTVVYVALLSFLAEFNPLLLHKLGMPKFSSTKVNLDLSENIISQFNLVDTNKKSLFNILNQTSTIAGKRYLKRMLLNPSTDQITIQKSYDNIEKIMSVYVEFERELSNIYDLEKLHRKIHNQKLKAPEFVYLDRSYQAIRNLITLVRKYNLEIPVPDQFDNFIEFYTKIIDIPNIKDIEGEVENNIFKFGYNIELDRYFKFNQDLHQYLANLARVYAVTLNRNDSLKIEINKGKRTQPAQEYTLHVNETQKNILKNAYQDLEFSSIGSGYRVSSASIRECSEKIVESQSQINSLTRNLYSQFLNLISTNYARLLEELAELTNIVDFTKSNAKAANLYKYCKPVIKNVNKAFINSKGLRHPIVEQVQTGVQFVANDCQIGDQFDGLIMYSINGSGKSVFSRSIGISLIMAQAGMYVPAENYTYGIYKRILSKINGSDDLYQGKSYFINEALQIKQFLDSANPYTLIIGDEIAVGTEVPSQIAIVASTIKYLSKTGASFIFSTHLHNLPDLEAISSLKNIKILSFSVTFSTNELIYNRKITEEKCLKLYGVEIASFLGLKEEMIQDAFQIRNILLENETSKTSNYNSNVIMDKCKVCGTTSNLQTHHITHQAEFAKTNQIPFDKNAEHNLVVLCNKCHNSVHHEQLNIKGYVHTSNGIKLQFEDLKDLKI